MSSGKSRRASPTTAASAATPAAASAPGIGAEQLDDVILMMHQIVLRESAASRGRVTPVGRETARAILRIQGAAKTGRGIPTDAAASTALRYLFRDVAAKLAAVWRKIAADATPEKSVLWERRAQFAELEEIYAALGISDFSDPLELKLKDIGAVYDSFRRQATHEDHYDIVAEEVGTAIDDIARGPLAEIQEAISLFPTALKARILRAMRLSEFKDELALARNLGSDVLYELASREVPNPAEKAVRAIAKSAQDREDAALNVADFAEKVFGAAIAGGAKGNKKK
jgi:hypothetical protein